MGDRFVMIQGIVGSNSSGTSIHQGTARNGQECRLAYVGLRNNAELVWQEIELSPLQAVELANMLSNGNTVRVSGTLEKQLGLPIYRVRVEQMELVRVAQPLMLSTAA